MVGSLLLIFLQLATGDTIIDGHLAIRYSGEVITWIACADMCPTCEPGEYAEFRIYNLETNELVASGSSPLVVDRFTFQFTPNRVALYGGEVRTCNDADPEPLCSDWVDSGFFAGNPTPSNCGPGPEFVYVILAPPGAPEL